MERRWQALAHEIAAAPRHLRCREAGVSGEARPICVGCLSLMQPCESESRVYCVVGLTFASLLCPNNDGRQDDAARRDGNGATSGQTLFAAASEPVTPVASGTGRTRAAAKSLQHHTRQVVGFVLGQRARATCCLLAASGSTLRQLIHGYRQTTSSNPSSDATRHRRSGYHVAHLPFRQLISANQNPAKESM